MAWVWVCVCVRASTGQILEQSDGLVGGGDDDLVKYIFVSWKAYFGVG